MNNKVLLFVCLIIFLAGGLPGNAQRLEMSSSLRLDPVNPAFLPDEVIIKFKDEVGVSVFEQNQSFRTNLDSFNRLLDKIHCHSIRKVFRSCSEKSIQQRKVNAVNGAKIPLLYKYYRLKIAPGQDIHDVISLLKNDPAIERAEPNYRIYSIDVFPNDPIYQVGAQWHIDSVHAPAAWSITTSDTSQVIGILDTGIDWNHPDLAGNIWNNPGEIPGNGIDDDNNGFIDDCRGWDFINDDNNPADDNSHGTHVAGIAAAVTNNATGVAGIAWHARLMAVKILQSTGQGNAADFAEGIQYAMDNSATVINMSVGSYAESFAVKSALEYAYSSSTPVAAAGNDFYNIDLAPMYPACYSFVLGVQASDFYGQLAEFSNFDPDGPVQSLSPELLNYEVCAPGVAIYSTFPFNAYHALSGTSMATPVISGTVALLRSYFPGISNEKIFVRLIQGSENGIVNIYKSLTMTPVPDLSFTGFSVLDTMPGCDSDGIADAGETIQILASMRNCGGYADSVWARLRLGNYEDTTVAIIHDSFSLIGDMSEYASMDNRYCLFKVHIPSFVAHNRDIVFTIFSGAANSDTLQKNFIIKVQNAKELMGVMDSLMILTPDKLWLVKRSFRVGINGILRLLPGTTMELQKGIVNRGRVEGFGTPDSMITIYGPAAVEGGSWSFSYSHFFYTTNMYGDECPSSKRYLSNRLNHCILESTGPWYLASAYHCSFINMGGGWYMDTLMYCNFEVEGWAAFRPNYFAYNNISGNCPNFWYEGLENARVGPNNIVSTTIQYYFKCPSLPIPPLFYYGTTDTSYIEDHIYDYEESLGICPQAVFTPILTVPTPLAHGLAWKIHINGKNPQENILDPIGAERVRFDVWFNRPMDTTHTPQLSFGVREPYNQHIVSDSSFWSNDRTVWTAYYDVSLETGDGLNYLRVQNARDPEGFIIPLENNKRFKFMIQAAGASGIPFVAIPGIGRSFLHWAHASSPDALGYNLYRFTSTTDTIRLNAGFLLTDTAYIDYNVIPDTSYHYLYNIIGTDFKESDFSKVVICAPLPAEEGDANGDSLVNVLDITTVISYLMSQAPFPFLFDAADINNDAIVNVLDIIGIVDIILSKKKPTQARGLVGGAGQDPVHLRDVKNVLSIHGAFARPGDTITISASIENTDKFISFQFDLPLPDGVSFLSNSAMLGSRGTNHVVIGNVTGTGLLRIFSYSPDNSFFLGNSGDVVSFRLIVGSIRGEFPLAPENCIIGDSLSLTILTGTENGILSVFPIGMDESGRGNITMLEVIPNPAVKNSFVRVSLDKPMDAELVIYSLNGTLLDHKRLGGLQAGVHTLPFPREFYSRLTQGSLYILALVPGNGGKTAKRITCIIMSK